MSKYIQQIKLVILALILGLGVSYALAWTNPASSPPDNGTISPPITTGSALQDKAGRLRLNTSFSDAYGLDVFGTSRFYGNIEVGTTSIPGKLKMVDGTQGAGKVLTSDASGLASWAAPAVAADVGITCPVANGYFLGDGSGYPQYFEFACKNGKFYSITNGITQTTLPHITPTSPPLITTNNSYPDKVACSFLSSTLPMGSINMTCDSGGYLTAIYTGSTAPTLVAGKVACGFSTDSQITITGSAIGGADDDVSFNCKGGVLTAIGVNSMFPWR